MSRGRVNPPPVVLKIERLSDGQPRATSGPMVDDFTGQPIEPMLMVGPTRPLATAQELILAVRRRAVVDKRLLLEHVGMLPKSVEYAQAKALARPIKQTVQVQGLRIHSKDQAFELTFPPKPNKSFRRI